MKCACFRLVYLIAPLLLAAPLFAQIQQYVLPNFGGSQNIIAGPDGAYWFTEFAATALGRIDSLGNLTQPFGFPGNNGPLGITIGPDGNIWVTEAFSNQVACIRPGLDGSYTNGVLTEYPINPGINTNCEASGIAAGPDGNLWFVEFLGNKIGVMNTNGVVLHEYGAGIIPPMSQLYNLTLAPDGAMWFAEVSYGTVGRITTSGVITQFPMTNSIFTNNVNCVPYDIITGPDGALWITEYNANRIGRLTTNGVYTNFTLPTYNTSPNNNYSQLPTTITLGPDGNMWFTEYAGGNISRITPSGLITEFGIPFSSTGPRGITSGPDKNIWVVDNGANSIDTFLLPTLSISLSTNSQFVLTWPSAATDYALQGNTNLSTTNWVEIPTPTVPVVSNYFVYTNTVSNLNFFRLYLYLTP